MAIIYSYPETTELLPTDLLIGTSTIRVAGKKKNITKNFTLELLKNFILDGNTGVQWGTITGLLSNQTDLQNALDAKQNNITLTTTGSSGPATLVGSTLNIPNYAGVTYTFTSPLVNTAGVVTINQSSAITDGYLSSADWITFNSKQEALSGTGFVKISGTTISYDNTTYYPYPTGTTSQYVRGDGSLATFPTTSVPTLNQVLTAGNVSLLDAKIGVLYGYDNNNADYGTLEFYDSGVVMKAATTNKILFYNDGLGSVSFSNGAYNPILNFAGVGNNLYTFQNANGTLAFLSDIPSLAGYVPTSRTLTINGTTYDLSANRTWSVGTVTSVSATGPITSSGGTTPTISTSMATNKLIGRSTAGTGVMEEITIGTGLTLSAGALSATATGGGIPHATASGTDTYTATVTGVTSYADGDAYLIRFTNGNTTGATLNINALGAIPLYRNNDGQLIGGDIWSGGEMLCVYNSTTNVFQCIGTSPNSLFAYITNDDSVAITKGQPVYAFGGTGDRMTVKRAFNTSDATSAKTVGVVVTSSIAVNQKGIIIIQGLLDGLSILPTATWSDGDTVYLGTTAGSITNIKQYAPNHLVYLGTVTTASNGSSGRWYVRVQNGYELDELHNVQAQTPSLKDTLWYDNTVSPAQWKTASISTILGYTPFNLPSLTSGSVLFSNGTTIAQDNANFFWNDSNNRLGIGTSAPTNSLTIQDSSYSQIVLKSSANSEGISSFLGGNLASFDTSYGFGRYQYSALTMIPSYGFLTYLGYEVLTGNITTGYIPRKAPIGVVDSLIYDDGTNVGINTISPSATLHVNGSMYLQNAATGVESITFSSGPLISNDGPSGIFKSGEVYTDTINGRVGVATITPATALDVNGVITATGGNSTSWNAKQDAITLTTTGSSGPATLVGATLNIPEYAGGSATPIDIQLFTSSGVWTKPAGATIVEIYLVGAGAGGGSGRRGATLTARYGGGGGSSGPLNAVKLQASALGATENVWIGAGGNGGAAITVNDTNGNNGSAGTASFFGGTGSLATSLVSTNVSIVGNGGTAISQGGSSYNPSYYFSSLLPASTYASPNNNPNTLAPSAASLPVRSLLYGGLGGGLSTTNVSSGGQQVNITAPNTSRILYSSAAGANGALYTTTSVGNLFMSTGGGGGRAGTDDGVTAAVAGGNGGPGSGGAGGGASTNGFNSGAGGRGGDGFCMILTYF